MTSRLPSGTITVLFADLEGSSPLWERYPDAMADVLERYRALMEAATSAHGGTVIKCIGDEVDCVFPLAPMALRAALDAHAALKGEHWQQLAPGLRALRVRMGMHTGTAVERMGDYFGSTINRVSRLLASANGGQVLMTLATQQLVRDELPAGVRLRDRGEYRFRGLEHSDRVYQLVSPTMPDNRQALRSTYQVPRHDPVWVETARSPAGPSAEPEAKSPDALLGALRQEGRVVKMAPEEAQALAQRAAGDLDSYRLGRIAFWSQPRYRLDEHFVQLSVLHDRGEAAEGLRWQPGGRRYADLAEALLDLDDPALVLLGAPGSGKSTLLSRLDYDLALAGIRDQTRAVSIYVSLTQYRRRGLGDDAPSPLEWLEEQWRRRQPALPSVETLIGEGRLFLLADGLNEMPHHSHQAYREQIQRWKQFLQDGIVAVPGNRAVFTCRSLDYSAPLSSPALPVPQLQIGPLDDEQIHQFLECYSPAASEPLWAELRRSGYLDALRSPYFLRLFVDQANAEGYFPQGRTALLTSFIWNSARREVERDHPLFQPDGLLSERDCRALLQAEQRRSPLALPEHGPLFPKLSALAFAMQGQGDQAESSQVQIPYATGLQLLAHDRAEDILEAGMILGVLEDDSLQDELRFVHQLLQEYLAARQLAKNPDPGLVRVPWQSAALQPPLAQVLAGLAPADPLPPAPTTCWDETMVMAVALCPEADAVVRALAEANLSVAARCAAAADAQVSTGLRSELAWKLVRRSRDPAADRRARIEAGLRLGELGDPRLERQGEADRRCLVPSMVDIPGGSYRLGHSGHSDAGSWSVPERQVEVTAFKLATTAVTNAEWACFVAAGGYDDPRWWDSPGARDWQLGRGTSRSARRREQALWQRFKADPDLIEVTLSQGLMPTKVYERWHDRLKLDAEAFAALLETEYPDGRRTVPLYMADDRFNQPTQPVVGISWFEARAYANWLATLTGRPFRLPTELEWEAAARGFQGRRYAWGDDFEPERANLVETHVRRTTPVGVHPDGDTPSGLYDMIGNIFEWTSSRADADPPNVVGGPSRPDHDRDEAEEGLIVLRGGAWDISANSAHAARRAAERPDIRGINAGMRLAANA